VARLKHLLIKETTQLRRDRRLFGVLVLAPVLQLVVLGFAANMDIREIDVAVRDDDHTQESREYVRALGASGYLRPFYLTGQENEDDDLLVAGDAKLVLVIPPGFGRHLTRGESATAQVLVDGANSNVAVLALSYVQKATQGFMAGLIVDARDALGAGARLSVPQVTFETRAWYNPDLASRNYMVPGVMGLLLLVTTMIVGSMAFVKEREQGTMEQLIVTPLRSGELIVGKMLPFVVVGFVEMTLTLPIMRFALGVPFRGNLALLYLFAGLFLLTTLGLGLFISSLVRTQQQAMMVAAFFVMMPFMLLSGFTFPIASMPKAFQVVAAAIPLKYFLIAVRGIFLKGVGWRELWPNAVVLLGWGAGILSLAVVAFRKRIG